MDSYKKVRFSDFIYMCRMDTSKDIFDPAVAQFILTKDMLDTNTGKLKMEILKIQSKLSEELTPFEIKITKSKDAGKDEFTYMLFSKINLRIYNNLKEYLFDRDVLLSNSSNLANDIIKLTGLALTSVVNESLFDDEEDPDQAISVQNLVYDDDEKAPFLS